jgi:ribonuclease J
MKLKIHRGSHEIGGSCVEIETGNTRILLDFGMPLKDPSGADFNERAIEGMPLKTLIEKKYLFDIEGLYRKSASSISGIFISHSHKDHYGFLSYIYPEIPVYMSEGAYKLIRALNIFLPEYKGVRIGNPRFLHDREKVTLGELSVTPYLVDHSGFNAMGFLVKEEETGKTILYTGDFRAGGWTKKRYEGFIKKPLGPVDYLLMEGTMIERESGKYPDEESIVQGVTEAIQKSKNTVIPLYCSGQNIDRIVSLYKAARKTKSILVVDPYTACMLRVAGEITGTTPEIEWDSIRVFVANYGEGDIYVNKIAKSSHKEMIISIGRKKIKIFDFAHLQQKSLLLMRNTMIPVVEKIPQIRGATLIYSLWKGYIEKDNPDAKKFREFVKRNHLTVEHIHTSGHAALEQLKIFAKKVNAKQIVPIHTERPEKFKEHFGNTVVRYNDGQYLDI